MISHEHLYVFVHIPKTGGTSVSYSIARRLKPYPHGWDRKFKKYKQHLTMSELSKHGYLSSNQFSLYFKFAFVRNPWDRFLSEFMYRKRLHGKSFSCGFKEFLINGQGDAHRRAAIKQHIRPQCEFVYDEDGNQLVDFIGRFENQQEDFNQICDKLGILHKELTHENKSDHKPYWEYYDDEIREIVAEKYKKDIKVFGYKFGE